MWVTLWGTCLKKTKENESAMFKKIRKTYCIITPSFNSSIKRSVLGLLVAALVYVPGVSSCLLAKSVVIVE